MRRLLFCAALLLFGQGAASAQPTAAQKAASDAPALTFMTEHRPPNNYLDPETGEVVGLNAEILRKTLARAGLQARFELAQWSRSYAMALTSPNTCVFSTVRNAKREALFKWVGPFGKTVFAMVARKGSGIVLKAVEDARPYRIGVFTQDVREVNLRHLGGFIIDAVPEDLFNARKLLEKRIDLWFTDLETLEEEVPPKQRAQMEIVLQLAPEELYLACNKSVSDAQVGAMNQALRDVLAGGR